MRGGFDRSNTRGLAFFACKDPELWKVVPLPMQVRSRVVVNDQPAVGELQSMVEHAARLGVLLVDRQRARTFVFSFDELIEHTEADEPLPREVDVRAHAERSDHAGHEEALVDQHLHRAAALAFETFQRTSFDRFTIGAPDDLLPRLREAIHPYLRSRLCARIDVQPGASTDRIRQVARAVEAQAEAEREAQVVARLIDAVSTGRAVEGLEATLAVLGQQRASSLVVSKGFAQPGWRCTTCEVLSAQGRACPVCGEEMVGLRDVVEEAIEFALTSSSEVEVIEGDADLDVHGRIGAHLRY